MNKVIEELRSVEKELAEEKGTFVLFALFEREDVQDRWDLVVSAPWFGKNRKETLQFIVDKVNSRLTPVDIVMLSRVVLLAPTDAFVRNVNSVIRVEHGTSEFRDCVFNGIPVKRAYIFTSMRIPEQPYLQTTALATCAPTSS
jgi:hypothetical protein